MLGKNDKKMQKNIDEALLGAVIQNNKEEARQLIAQGAKAILCSAESNYNPFHFAILHRNYEMFCLLGNANSDAKYLETALNDMIQKYPEFVAEVAAKLINEEKVAPSTLVNAITANINKLNQQQKNAFMQNFRQVLQEEHVSNAFIRHLADIELNTVDLLMDYGVSSAVLITAIKDTPTTKRANHYLKRLLQQKLSSDELNNIMQQTFDKFVSLKDWSFIDPFISNYKGHDCLGWAVLIAAYHNRTDIVEQLIAAQAKADNWHFLDTKYIALHWAVMHDNLKMFHLLRHASSKPETIQTVLIDMLPKYPAFVAQVLADLISEEQHEPSSLVNCVLLSVPKLDKDKIIIFKNSFHTAFKKDHVDDAFKRHLVDNDYDTVDLLMDCGVSKAVLIHTIEECSTTKEALHYLKFLLQQKLNEDEPRKIMQVVINKFCPSSDWSFVDPLIANYATNNSVLKCLDNALTNAAKNNMLAVAQKLINGGATTLCYHLVDNIQYHPLHWTIANENAQMFTEIVKLSSIEFIETALKDLGEKHRTFIDERLYNLPLTFPSIAAKLCAKLMNQETNSPSSWVYQMTRFRKKNNQVDEEGNLLQFKNELRGLLNQQQVDEAFRRHIVDEGYGTVRILMDYGVSSSVLLDAIKSCFDPKEQQVYLTQLLQQQANPDEMALENAIKLAIDRAKLKNDWSLIELIASKCQGHPCLNEALLCAVEHKNYKTVNTLLDAGAEHKTVLGLVLEQKNNYMAALLVCPAEKREKLLQQTSQYNENFLNAFYVDFSQTILPEEKNEQLLPYYQAAVLKAVNENDTNTVQALLNNNPLKLTAPERKKLQSYQDDEGNTMLHTAVAHDNPLMLALLLDMMEDPGANPKPTNHKGKTPEHLAAEKGDLFIVKLLRSDLKSRNTLLANYLKQIPKSDPQISLSKLNEQLQHKESDKKSMIRRAVAGQVDAITDTATYYKENHHYYKAMLFSFLVSIYSNSQAELLLNKQYIESLNLDGLALVRNRQSLKRLQNFLLACLKEDILRQMQQHRDQDPITLLLLAMEQLKDNYPTQTWNELKICIRSIIAHAKGLSKRNLQNIQVKLEIDQEMGIKKEVIEQLIMSTHSEQETDAPQSVDLFWEQKSEKATFLEALTGNANAIRRMAEIYQQKRGCREKALLFHCLAVAYSSSLSAQQHKEYMDGIKSYWLSSLFKIKDQSLQLMKEFLQQHTASDQLKKLKEAHHILDPITLIFFALDKQLTQKQEQKKPYNSDLKIYERLKTTIKSVLQDLGYTKLAINQFMIQHQDAVSSLGIPGAPETLPLATPVSSAIPAPSAPEALLVATPVPFAIPTPGVPEALLVTAAVPSALVIPTDKADASLIVTEPALAPPAYQNCRFYSKTEQESSSNIEAMQAALDLQRLESKKEKLFKEYEKGLEFSAEDSAVQTVQNVITF